MRAILWTAFVAGRPLNHDMVLVAQDKSSRASLQRRLLADDPIWTGRIMFKRSPQFNARHFRNGLAIKCITRMEFVNKYG